MHSLWGKTSLKKEMDEKEKTNRGRFITLLHQKLKHHLGRKKSGKSEVSQRYSGTGIDLPLLQVSRFQSFLEDPQAQPLPLPVLQSTVPSSLDVHGSSKPLPPDFSRDLPTASVSSNCSIDSNDQPDSQLLSPQASVDESANATAVNSPSRHKDHASILRKTLKDELKLVNHSSGNHMPLASTRNGSFSAQVTELKIVPRDGYFSAPGSYISSPSRSPVNDCTQRRDRLSHGVGRLCSDNCSFSASGVISRHYPIGDLSSNSPQNRYSPNHSPTSSPRMASPSQCSCRKSGQLHPWTERFSTEFSMDSPNDGKLESHKLPLPPMTPTCSCRYPPSNLGRPEKSISHVPCWRKGRLVGSGTFGHVYLGFNSYTGEMCAIKEVTLFIDDARSQERAQQLEQEITLLRWLQHPNVVRYFGSGMVDNKLFIYLEYVSGGSINKLLQGYGKLSESVIRRYTRQILFGLAYLHSKNTVHRDVKGANILVCPSGQVKLADFGMAKHITDSCPLSFKGSPYWMAPEIIRNCCGSNLAVDIWSLGCTVIEMATTKPPWSQYEGVAALFKIGYSKELPAIPDSLSDEGKDFVSICLQRNPLHRPTAFQLLDHPFVREDALPERRLMNSDPLEPHFIAFDAARNKDRDQGKTISSLNSEGVAVQLSRDLKHVSGLSNPRKPKHVSCPVSPIGSPLLISKPSHSQPMCRRMHPVSSSQIASGSSMTCSSRNVSIPANHFDHSMPYFPDCMGARSSQKSEYSCGTPLYGKTKVENLSRIVKISLAKKNQ